MGKNQRTSFIVLSNVFRQSDNATRLLGLQYRQNHIPDTDRLDCGNKGDVRLFIDGDELVALRTDGSGATRVKLSMIEEVSYVNPAIGTVVFGPKSASPATYNETEYTVYATSVAGGRFPGIDPENIVREVSNEDVSFKLAA